METQTHDGRRIRLMTLIDEFTRKCLAIKVARRINAIAVIETLADTMLFEGLPTYIRSDNGPEMVAKVLREWLTGLGTRNLYIEPGSPWENGYCESFNGKFRDECLNGEIFYNLGRAGLLILDDWGLEPLDAAARHDLLEILEDRYGRRSTMVTSQLPVDRWNEIIGDPTYADAILDRLVHNAHRIDRSGDSLRKIRSRHRG